MLKNIISIYDIKTLLKTLKPNFTLAELRSVTDPPVKNDE